MECEVVGSNPPHLPLTLTLVLLKQFLTLTLTLTVTVILTLTLMLTGVRSPDRRSKNRSNSNAYPNPKPTLTPDPSYDEHVCRGAEGSTTAWKALTTGCTVTGPFLRVDRNTDTRRDLAYNMKDAKRGTMNLPQEQE